jgi:hypothetical protein
VSQALTSSEEMDDIATSARANARSARFPPVSGTGKIAGAKAGLWGVVSIGTKKRDQ